MIHAVVFDIGNVVCSFEPDRRLNALAQCTGLEPARIHEAIWTSGLDDRAEAGGLSAVDVTRALLDALDNRIDAVMLRAAWSRAFIPDPNVSQVVGSLDCPTFAFTNNGPIFTECLAHELSEVERLFDRVICSWQLRARKPDAAAFERLCTEIHRDPAELLFIDDSVNNIESARSVGLTAVAFTSAERLAKDLDQLSVR
jgi:putative hydrolase of the HAD superfamily